MSEGKPITTMALLRLCYPSNTGQFLLPDHFVAPVPPRFINFLASEIRAKVFDGGIVRTEGRPGTIAGLSFGRRLFQPVPAKWLWVLQMGGNHVRTRKHRLLRPIGICR